MCVREREGGRGGKELKNQMEKTKGFSHLVSVRVLPLQLRKKTEKLAFHSNLDFFTKAAMCVCVSACACVCVRERD